MGFRPAALPLVAALVVAACSGAASPSPSASPSASPSPSPSARPPGPSPSPGPSDAPSAMPSSAGAASSQLVLRVEMVGGFMAPGARRAQVPEISVFADGRIYAPGAVTMIYPGPLMTPVLVSSVGPAGAAGILVAARKAGLTGADASYPPRGVADVPNTVITVVHDGTTTVTTIGALNPDATTGAPADEVALRKAAVDLLGRLSTNDPFGGTPVPAILFRPAGFRVWATPGAPQATDPSLVRSPVAWPLAAPLASFGTPDLTDATAGARMGDVVGADAATLGPVLEAATQITPFSSGGQQYTLVVRPLLPDEVAAAGG